MNWLERARCEISENAETRTADTAIRSFQNQAPTAKTAERPLTAVMAVPTPEIYEKSDGALAGAPAEQSKASAACRVPEPYVDGWARLQRQRPACIPELQWRQALDAASRFFDQWGTLAETFGWSPGDLFDLPHDGRPGGLTWCLLGETVRALGPDHAITISGRVFDRRQGGHHGA
jgi:hypothetical protein